ncbi:MAG: hypothetical protein COA41_11565 [Sphingopyxis sp.]|nr:MAG: hypothetical protein COA41_11565 [Sphingopyxis sp.]
MKKYVLLAACLASLSVPSIASAIDDHEHFVQGCREVLVIYANRDKQRLLAGLTTSPTEALRAGYCIGAISEYQRERECFTNDWYEQAQRISEMSDYAINGASVEELLETSCEI